MELEPRQMMEQMSNDQLQALQDQVVAVRMARLQRTVEALADDLAKAKAEAAITRHRIDNLDATNIQGDARQRLSTMVRKYAYDRGINYSAAWKNFDQSFNSAYHRNLGLMMTNHAKRLGRPVNKVTRPDVLEAYDMIEDALRVADKMLNRVERST